MKALSLLAATAASVVAIASVSATPAAAYYARKTITYSHGYHGHGCRTVRTVGFGARGKSVYLRKVCR